MPSCWLASCSAISTNWPEKISWPGAFLTDAPLGAKTYCHGLSWLVSHGHQVTWNNANAFLSLSLLRCGCECATNANIRGVMMSVEPECNATCDEIDLCIIKHSRRGRRVRRSQKTAFNTIKSNKIRTWFACMHKTRSTVFTGPLPTLPTSQPDPTRPPWPMWMQIASRMASSRKAWKARKVSEPTVWCGSLDHNSCEPKTNGACNRWLVTPCHCWSSSHNPRKLDTKWGVKYVKWACCPAPSSGKARHVLYWKLVYLDMSFWRFCDHYTVICSGCECLPCYHELVNDRNLQ